MEAEPLLITTSSVICDIDFHPSKNLVCGATMDGSIECFSYEKESFQHQFSHKIYPNSATVARFTSSGDSLFSGGSNGQINLSNMEKQILWTSNPAKSHSCDVTALCVMSDSECVSGDDNGVIRFWDSRQPQSRIASLTHHTDYISSLLFCQQRNAIVCSSSDGTVSLIDSRTHSLLAHSLTVPDEILSCTLVNNNTLVVGGTQCGALVLFDWTTRSLTHSLTHTLTHTLTHSLTFPGHPDSVDCLLSLDAHSLTHSPTHSLTHSLPPTLSHSLLSGCGDGMIRLVSAQPSELIGVFGVLPEDIPVERLRWSHDHEVIGCCSFESNIRLFDASVLSESMSDESVSEGEDGDESVSDESMIEKEEGDGDGSVSDNNDDDDDDGDEDVDGDDDDDGGSVSGSDNESVSDSNSNSDIDSSSEPERESKLATKTTHLNNNKPITHSLTLKKNVEKVPTEKENVGMKRKVNKILKTNLFESSKGLAKKQKKTQQNQNFFDEL